MTKDKDPEEPEIKEKKIKNKININPEFKEAVEELGGRLLTVEEVEEDPKKAKKPVKEDVKRDEYGDPIGGPKISKKQKAKNLAKNTPDEQHTTTTSEAFSDWRHDLREIIVTAEKDPQQPEIKEKKIKNKITINTKFNEAVDEIGG